MKKSILLLIVLISTVSFSQSNDNTIDVITKKHEVRLGVVKLLAGTIFESSYEYVQDSNKGFGATVLINFDKSNDYLEDYSLTPYYRMYFQKRQEYGARGFFVEGFTSFFGGHNSDEYIFDNATQNTVRVDGDDFFDVSLGLALGQKWINSAGFVFEIKLGAGRNLLGESENDALFKGDFSIGYRF